MTWLLRILLTLSALPALAVDDSALNQELAFVLSAQGLTCGRVVRVRTQAPQDYLVACQDGSNYQITADAQGKLVAYPLGMKIH